MASAEVMQNAKDWVRRDTNAATRAPVEKLLQEVAAGDEAASATLSKLFSSRLKFGTSEMAPGTARMNTLVIVQATQGLCSYLESVVPELKTQGICIGYDHRARDTYNVSSKGMAEVAAAVFLSRGVKTYLFSELVHTPLVPYCVTSRKLAAGIMVTASHNPKEDNGYKVYWSNGASIVSPHDTNIQAAILGQLEPWEDYAQTIAKGLYTNELCVDPLVETSQLYFEEMKRKLCRHGPTNAQSKIKVVYTAMHGVGYPYQARAIETFNLPAVLPVKEQQLPDPTFPTVPFPNPEEAGALDLAKAFSEAEGATLVIANDPDADRLACAERDPTTGVWTVFSGNDIGTLLAAWQWEKHDGSPASVVVSVVSSKFLKAMGEKEGFGFEETYTGFKWLCNLAIDVEARGRKCLLAYEQSIGYSLGDMVRDKDGVSAGAVFVEMATQLEQRGQTCAQYLQSLFEKYGFFHCQEGYLFVPDPKLMLSAFANLRGGAGIQANIDALLGLVGAMEGANVVRVVDYTNGYDSSTADKKSALVAVPETEHIAATLANGCTIQIRGSGTEPKLKFYVEATASQGPQAKSLANEIAVAVAFKLLAPEQNGFKVPDFVAAFRG